MKKLNYPNRPLRAKGTVNTETENTIPFGGLHAAPVGTSTTDQTDQQREAEAIESFNAALQAAITEQFAPPF